MTLFASADGGDKINDEDEDIDLGDKDWRAFRAKLVLSGIAASKPSSSEERTVTKTNNESTLAQQGEATDVDGIGAIFSSKESLNDKEYFMTPLDPSQWAYDSGEVIEQGTVILGGVEQEYGFGLRQQYFHKVAILVLDHDEKQFTKGIILNRPTDLTLKDDINDGVEWNVWFGGDVQGLASPNPDIVCLHSLKDNQAMRASVPVIKDIQWTTFENAKRLVKIGVAKSSDFWVFAGYAGWGPGQLMGELDRKSWYMVATDSQTLLQELSRQMAGTDPRDAGLDTWNLLMSMIGRTDTATEYSGGFDDLMLKEWALQNLLSKEGGGGGGMVSKISIWGQQTIVGVMDSTNNFLPRQSLLTSSVVEKEKLEENVGEGSLVRASAAYRSPFLLDDQEFHKSLVLIINDDQNLSVGVILNRSAAKGIDVEIKDSLTGQIRSEVMPLHYGGQYAIRGNNVLLWLHCSHDLKSAGIGSKIGDNKKNGIYKCTLDDVKIALGNGLAKVEDFLVVSGVSVWAKGGTDDKGMQGLVQTGKFELIEKSKTNDVWSILLMQGVLSEFNLSQNLAIANKAWLHGSNVEEDEQDNNTFLLGGSDENFVVKDNKIVFKSDVKVSDLSDKALQSWVATFLLGAPLLDKQ